ncbi:hypothetical protein [Treponema succinifaciens]|uniref:hypothetical protein n=1 Tax=Treponema succinifaciens TaxID=167 RepID=UPI003F7DF334
MDSEDFKKDFNIYAKLIYREWLMEAIERDDSESFRKCILNLGIEWHVIRTVKKVKRDDFCKNLWDNRKNIQNGTYSGWAESPYDAYSYKSKVCFLINPQYYKLIYDSKNRDAINEENCKPANWQDVVDKYYEKDKKEFLKSEKDVLKIFEIDYYLWNKEKQS